MNIKTYSGNNIARKTDSAYFDMWDTFLYYSYRLPDHKDNCYALSEYFGSQRQKFPDRLADGVFRDKDSREAVLSDIQCGIEEIRAIGHSLDLVPLLEKVQNDIRKVPFQATSEA
jgi:hypothetical protein